jgi:hypothetical protein
MTVVHFWTLARRAALLAGLWLPSAVRAETALLLPPSGDPNLQAQQEQGQAALRAALEGQGIQLISREQAVRSLPSDEGRDCVRVDCAPVLLRPAGADFAVAMALWSAGGSAPTRSVFITLVGAQGARFPGSAVIAGDDVVAAVRSALNDARGLQLLGPGPWLKVHGTPEGAEVHVDGAVVGSLPYRAAIEAGLHTLEVRADGHGTLIRSVQVPPNSGRQVDVQVALEARGTGAVAATNASASESELGVGRDTERVRPLWGPLVLGVAGLGVLTADLVLVLADRCEVESEGRCLAGNDTPTGAAVAWGLVGASAIAGAVLWRIFGGHEEPKEARVTLTPAPDGLRMDLHHRF